MKLLAYFTFVLAASVVITPLRAHGAGDPQNGRTLAQEVCSECHATQGKQVRSPNTRAPTFPELAMTPGMTSAALTVALTTPHAGMPMFRLTYKQREDIIAYILGLGKVTH